MEYAKDIILDVHYGQALKKQNNLWSKILQKIGKHKIITTIVFITLILTVLDIILVTSFIQILTTI